MAENNNISRQPATIPSRVGGNPNQRTLQVPTTLSTTPGRIASDRIQRGIDRTNKREQIAKEVQNKIPQNTKQAFGIQPGLTTATGLEKAIFISGDAILKAQFAIDGLFYGKFNYDGKNKLRKAIDKGVVNVINDLSEIDLCQILNYALQQVPGSEPFNPEMEVPKDALGKAKYNIQKKAYDTQLKIDGFFASYLESSNQESKAKGIYNVINQIRDAFGEIRDPEAQSALRDPRLLTAYPQIGPVNSFLEKAFVDFDRYTDYRQIPVEEVQKLVDRVEKTRAFLILIQGLSTPANAISFADSVFPNANIQDAIQRLQNLIDPSKLMPLLKNIAESLKKVQSLCNVLTSFVTAAQGIIRVVTLVVKVLKVVTKFLKALGIPNTFTVLGLTITMSEANNSIIKRLDALLDRLNQINTLLSLCVGLFTQLSIILFDLIAKINRMLVSLESCSNADPTIIKELQDARDGLQKTAEFFDDFVKNYENKKNTENATFGRYTIQIVTEEVVDDAISLRRRYGVALETNGKIIVQSSPTFASDNLVIINEVKALLASKGLVKQSQSLLSISEANTLSESLSYLFDNDITLNDLELDNFDNGLDKPDNEDENIGLGLNAFMNKLQGGKKLRARMRKLMIQNSQQLQRDLKAQDPEGKYSASIQAQAKKQENKLRLEQLESDKKKLQAALLANPTPVGKLTLLKKIKDIEQEIEKIKKEDK